MLTGLLVGGSTDVFQNLSLVLKVRWRDLQLVHTVAPTQAVEAIAKQDPSVLFLSPDASVPHWSDFITEVRTVTEAPLILIGEDSSAMDRVRAFELGADDWLSLNCLPMEFIAKVNTILRRAQHFRGASWTCGRLRIGRSHQVEIGGAVVCLSPREYRILCHLAERSGTPVRPDELLRAAWGSGYEGDSQLLRKTILRLRQKLSDNPPELILNQRGAGYMLATACASGEADQART